MFLCLLLLFPFLSLEVVMNSITALLIFAFALLCSCGCMCALFAHVVGVLRLRTALLLFSLYFLGLVAGAVYFTDALRFAA